MDKGQELFVKIHYKIDGEQEFKGGYNEKINFTAREGMTKYLMAGGVYNRNGGTIIFRAKDLDEANQIAKDNPMIRNISKRYKVQYDVSIFSRDIQSNKIAFQQ